MGTPWDVRQSTTSLADICTLGFSFRAVEHVRTTESLKPGGESHLELSVQGNLDSGISGACINRSQLGMRPMLPHHCSIQRAMR